MLLSGHIQVFYALPMSPSRFKSCKAETTTKSTDPGIYFGTLPQRILFVIAADRDGGAEYSRLSEGKDWERTVLSFSS